jgi:hypothetical protein
LFYCISDGLSSTVRTSTAHPEGGRDEVGFVYLEGKEEQYINDISILVKKNHIHSKHFYGPL